MISATGARIRASGPDWGFFGCRLAGRLLEDLPVEPPAALREACCEGRPELPREVRSEDPRDAPEAGLEGDGLRGSDIWRDHNRGGQNRRL